MKKLMHLEKLYSSCNDDAKVMPFPEADKSIQ